MQLYRCASGHVPLLLLAERMAGRLETKVHRGTVEREERAVGCAVNRERKRDLTGLSSTYMTSRAPSSFDSDATAVLHRHVLVCGLAMEVARNNVLGREIRGIVE